MHGLRVAVYYNFHRKCFSVVHKGKVIAHVDHIMLKDAEYRVSEKGRQRVIREQRKNVHAKVWGIVEEHETIESPEFRIRYNPYKTPTFIDMDGSPVYNTSYCRMFIDHRTPSILGSFA